VLAIGGVATILVAAFPLPATGTSQAHALVAGVSLTSLALWPAPAWRRER
jgi:LPXTG-motif cell wall-anchored protein